MDDVTAAPETRPRGPIPPTSISEAVGGPLGIVESALPAAAYVIAFSIARLDATTCAVIAVAIGVLLAIGRLARRQTLQFAVSGLFGVALAAFIVSRTGRAEDFFLPGLLANAAYATAYLISIVVRYPLLGILLGYISGQGMKWREDPAQLRAFTRASWIWVGLFLGRLAVQLPLYLAGAVVALGVARTAMGLPLFALGIWLSYLLLRGVPGIQLQRPAES